MGRTSELSRCSGCRPICRGPGLCTAFLSVYGSRLDACFDAAAQQQERKRRKIPEQRQKTGACSNAYRRGRRTWDSWNLLCSIFWFSTSADAQDAANSFYAHTAFWTFSRQNNTIQYIATWRSGAIFRYGGPIIGQTRQSPRRAPVSTVQTPLSANMQNDLEVLSRFT